MYSFSTDPTLIDVDVIHRMLSTTYWSPGVRREVVARALAHSLVALAIEDESRAVVGVARVVTDFATFAWIYDVFVEPAHRGRGIATNLIELVQRHPELQTLRRWVLATRDAHRLYEGLGFVPVRAGNWLEKRADPQVWQDPSLVPPSVE